MKKKRRIKEDYFFDILQYLGRDTGEKADIPVVLYMKTEYQDTLRYDEFVHKMFAKDQGLEIVCSYGDYDGAEGSSLRTGLRALVNAMYSDREWFALLIDDLDSFPLGSEEHKVLCDIKSHVPVFTMDFVKEYR
ncbi:MAG: hypothetical protein IJW70_03930 [Clostridia bacterium]|nr:hypothetical protein [Clostridia bacterium]